MAKKILFAISGIIAFILIFAFSFWMNIPERKTAAFIEYKVNQLLKGESTVRLNRFITLYDGIEARKISVFLPEEQAYLLEADYLRINISLIDLITKGTISLESKLYGGIVKADLDIMTGNLNKLRATDIKINRHPLIRKTDIILNNPKVNIEAETKLIKKQITGKIKINSQTILINGSPKNIPLPLEIPNAKIASLSASAELKKNKNIQVKLTLKGDLVGKMRGKIYPDFNRPDRTKLDLNIKGGISNQYQQKLGFLKEMLKSFFNKQNQINLKIKGSLRAPEITK